MAELALYVGGTIILLQQETCEAVQQGVRGEVQSSEVLADDQAVGPSPQARSTTAPIKAASEGLGSRNWTPIPLVDAGPVSCPRAQTTRARTEKGCKRPGSVKKSETSDPVGVGRSVVMNIPPRLRLRQVPWLLSPSWWYSTPNWTRARACDWRSAR